MDAAFGLGNRWFREGKGPEEIINAYRIVINKFFGNIFIVQEHGCQLKEFDPSGKYIKSYPMPEQIINYLEFIDKNRFIYIFIVSPRDKVY